MTNYLIVDGDGLVTNAIVWDGEAPYDPGAGVSLVEQPDCVGIGWRRDGESWVAPDQSE